MKLIFLGTGGYHPTEFRHTSSVFIPEIGLVLDAGTSAFRLPDRLETDRIQIILSHAHLDHSCGLTFLLPPLLSGRIKSAKVYGSASTIEAVKQHLFCDLIFPVLPDFEFHILDDALEVGGDGRLSHIRQDHPGGSLGFRIDWRSRSLAYLTDNFCDGSQTEFVRGVDLLIHESNFPDGSEELAILTGHSCTTPVATMAKAAGVKRLILTHFDPSLSGSEPIDLGSVRSIFPLTDLAEDLMEVEF